MRRLAVAGLALLVAAATASAQAPRPGRHDATFGSGGVAQAPFGAGARAAAVALAADGGLAVAGDVRGSGGESTLVARFTAAGLLDSAFNGTGLRLDRFGAAASTPQRGAALAVTPDGGTIVAGVAGDQIMIARHRRDGTLDPLFGAGGIVLRRLSGAAGRAEGTGLAAIALTASGQIVVAGSVAVPTGDPYEGDEPGERIVVGRLSDRGVPDPAFGDGGFALLQLGARSARRPARSRAAAVALAPDGRIVIAGRASDTRGGDRALLARLTAAGRLDTGFARAGRALAQLGLTSAARPPRSAFHALVLRAGGTLLAAGEATDVAGNEQAVLARFGAGGAPDPGFGRGGVLRAHLDDETSRAPRSIARALAPAAGDAVFVAGSATGGDAFTSRITARGRLDCAFGSFGHGDGFGPAVGGTGDPAADGAFAALTQPDGRLVIAGRAARGGLLLGRIHGGAGTAPSAARPALLTLPARYLGRGRAIAYGVVDGHCAAAAVRFAARAASGGGLPIVTRSQRVAGAAGRQVVCARLRGLRPGRTYRLRIESPNAQGAAGGVRVLRAIRGSRRALVQKGCI